MSKQSLLLSKHDGKPGKNNIPAACNLKQDISRQLLALGLASSRHTLKSPLKGLYSMDSSASKGASKAAKLFDAMDCSTGDLCEGETGSLVLVSSCLCRSGKKESSSDKSCSDCDTLFSMELCLVFERGLVISSPPCVLSDSPDMRNMALSCKREYNSMKIMMKKKSNNKLIS
ncbi:hypothetical protein E2C01_009183 [Portunus trituberculatus]|uniref:Uncharacterized protein n=1 Tax=Portunus trituberculatus TaxID=210409 RepID=A0A5B7D4N0_PORTR|nr:hypothetical protein [Portunus trituberculatus]